MIDAERIYIKLYALIGSIESDLTDIMLSLDENEIVDAKLETLSANTSVSDAIIEATLHQKIACMTRVHSRNDSHVSPSTLRSIENLVPIRNRVFHRKPLEFQDHEKTLSIATAVLRDNVAHFSRLRKTIDSLSQNEIAFLRSVDAVFIEDSSVTHNLPQADFYETGYIGRSKLRANLVKDLIKGSYPVITVVGEGGLGKTALALVAAWDITARDDNPFDVILWTTAKRTTLSGFEIDRHHSPITSGYDVLVSLREAFDARDRSEVRDAIQTLLSTFNTLIIIDNLETVIDDDLKWLSSNVPNGSKILFTSRVQLASGDKPIKLEALGASDARQLFKAFAGVCGLADQAALSNDTIDAVLGKLNFNPLFIKWYLQAIKTGCSHEQILSKRDVIIDFCMESVFDNLSENEKRVLGASLCTSAPRTLQKLSFVSKLSGDDLEDAVSGLIRRNIINQQVKEYKTFYNVNLLARNYVTSKRTISASDIAEYKKNERTFNSEIAGISPSNTWSYNPRDVRINDGDDWLAYKKVKSAGILAARGEYDDALKRIEEAKKLSPNYFEIYRVEGFVRGKIDDYLGALSAYETAIELKPDAPTVRYFFADFLIRSDDMDAASEQAEAALKMDPTSPVLMALYARTLTYLGRLDDAWGVISDLNINSLDRHTAVICLDRKVDILTRIIARTLIEQDFEKGERCIIYLANTINSVPIYFVDEGVKLKISKQHRAISSVVFRSQSLRDNELVIRCIIKPFLDTVEFDGAEKRSELDNMSGKIKTLDREKKFGFITDDYENDHFFHKSNLAPGLAFEGLTEGMRVSFGVGSNSRGECADSVTIAE